MHRIQIRTMMMSRRLACPLRNSSRVFDHSGSSLTITSGRFLSSAPSKKPDWVQASIQTLLDEHHAVATPSSRNVHKSLEVLQNRLHEVELCMQDCRDCPDETERTAEIASAELAVDDAVHCLTDLLDDLRAHGPSSSSNNNNEINGAASRNDATSNGPIATDDVTRGIRSLRAEIAAMKQRQAVP